MVKTKGKVNACEGYKIVQDSFLPLLVHSVRGFAAWTVLLSFTTKTKAPSPRLSLDKTRPRGIMKIQKGAVDLTVGPYTFND